MVSYGLISVNAIYYSLLLTILINSEVRSHVSSASISYCGELENNYRHHSKCQNDNTTKEDVHI